MRKQPSKDILQHFRNSGTPWIAVECNVFRALVQHFIDSGREVTKEIATADLHYWINRGELRTYSYMAKRWRWGEKRAYNLYVELGIYSGGKRRNGIDKGSNEEVSREQEGSGMEVISAEKGANVGGKGVNKEHGGSAEGARREAYVEEREEEKNEEHQSTRAREAAASQSGEMNEGNGQGAPDLGYVHLREIPTRIRDAPEILAVWRDFVYWRRHVQAKRIPVNRDAAIALLNKLKTAPDPIATIHRTMKHGWTDLYLGKVKSTNGTRKQQPIDYSGGF
jgi:hypothetical protein